MSNAVQLQETTKLVKTETKPSRTVLKKRSATPIDIGRGAFPDQHNFKGSAYAFGVHHSERSQHSLNGPNSHHNNNYLTKEILD